MIQVVDHTGKAAQLTAVGIAFRNGEASIPENGNKPPRAVVGTGSSVSLAPGEALNDAVSIENQFNLTEPGTYSIQLERVDPATKLVVKSNVVTLSVAK